MDAGIGAARGGWVAVGDDVSVDGWGRYLLLVLHPLLEVVVQDVAWHDMQCQRAVSIRNLQATTRSWSRVRVPKAITNLLT